MSADELQLILFGPGELWRLGAVPERLSTQPKPLALLVRLAVAPRSEVVRRDTLLALLWPDMDDVRARNALSQALHRLRRHLGKDVIRSHGREKVSLSPGVQSDVRRFREAIQAGRSEEALSLYRGEMLHGFHLSGAIVFQDWLDVQRRSFARAAHEAAVSLADREEEAGRLVECGRWLQRAVEVIPSDQVTLRRMIHCLERAGNTAGAIRAYESSAARLWAELEQEPEHETRKLVDRVRSAPGPSSDAVRRLVLRGRYMLGIPGQVPDALENFQRALAIEPDCVAALSGVAECLANMALLGHLPRAQAERPLLEAAQRAIELRPEEADAHLALGTGHLVFSRDWAGAEAAFRAAVEKDPWYAHARARLAFFLANMGWLAEGVRQAEMAVDLDPVDPLVGFIHGFTLYRARRFENALERLQDMAELHPRHALVQMFIAECALALGRTEEVQRPIRIALTALPHDPLITGIGACILGFAGHREEARSLLDRLRSWTDRRFVNLHFLASAHAGLGELDEAFRIWREMVDSGGPDAFMIGTDPLFDPLRADRRFQALIRDLEFPTAVPAAPASEMRDGWTPTDRGLDHIS